VLLPLPKSTVMLVVSAVLRVMLSLPVPPMMFRVLPTVRVSEKLPRVSVSVPPPRLTLALLTAAPRVIESLPVPPNIVMLDNPNVPEVAATGQLKPLNGLPGFTTSGYIPGAISECTYQGKQYCYPIGTNTIGLFYNKAMLKAAGLQPPTTWDELAADAKKLTKPPVYGMAFDATAVIGTS